MNEIIGINVGHSTHEWWKIFFPLLRRSKHTIHDWAHQTPHVNTQKKEKKLSIEEKSHTELEKKYIFDKYLFQLQNKVTHLSTSPHISSSPTQSLSPHILPLSFLIHNRPPHPTLKQLPSTTKQLSFHLS